MRLLSKGLLLAMTSLLMLLMGSKSASANTIYISQSGGTFSGGTACNGQTTQAYTYFNSSGNWTTATPSGNQIGPGTIVYVCGTISNQLVFNGSGTSGNVITLLFDSGAMLSASGTVWNANSPIWVGGHSYIVINGGISTVGGASTNLQATGNGSGLSTSLAVTGININNSSNITIENFVCGPLYQHTSASDTNPGADSGGCIYANPLGTNVTVANSTFHDATDGLLFSTVPSGTVNMNVYDNDFYNIDHDIYTTCNSSTASGFYFHDNQIHDPSNWDTTADAFHHDGWIVNITGNCDQLYDYNNWYYGNWGENNTSPIFLDGNGGDMDAIYVFNDVFMNSNATYTWNNGINLIILVGPAHVWNNTVICPSAGGIGMQVSGSSGMDFRNNVESGCSEFFSTSNAEAGQAAISAMDYNYYANVVASGNPMFSFLSQNSGSGSLATQFAAWQSIVQGLVSGGESHSGEGASAGLGTNGVPQAGSAVAGAGINLCNGIISCTGTLAALASDTSAGNTRTPGSRPSSGPWDIGAYIVNNATPDPPSSLVATAH